ncbi:MAG: hypothetical protein NVS3B1_23580 [Marmoricola sp.]
MAITIGSGLGGFAAIAPQPTYGAAFVTPTRTLTFKSAAMTYNPHIVQGGPYLRGGQVIDIGSAHVQTWLDATGSIMGDVVNTGHALLLATAMGSNAILTQSGTTTAYLLGGAAGAPVGAPDKLNGGTSGMAFDMQLAVPTADDATQRQENYHSCVITKAEWVFDRGALVTYNYSLDAQYVEKTTALITPTYPTAPVPFSMASTTSQFKIGAFGAEVTLAGVRKCTITLDRKMDVARAYIGNQYKSLPISNALADITVTLEADYTPAAKTQIFDLFLAGTPISVLCSAVGNPIGTSGLTDLFSLNATNCFVQTGGESPLTGPDLVKNSVVFKGTIDAAADPALIAKLQTADTGF